MTKWKRITTFLQWEVPILILIITSTLIKFRIGNDWRNAQLNPRINKRPCWDLIHDTSRPKTYPWTARLRYLYYTIDHRDISLYYCIIVVYRPGVSSTIINLILLYDPWNKSEGIPYKRCSMYTLCRINPVTTGDTSHFSIQK